MSGNLLKSQELCQKNLALFYQMFFILSNMIGYYSDNLLKYFYLSRPNPNYYLIILAHFVVICIYD